MLGVLVKTLGCIGITINAGVNRIAQPVWCTTSCLVVGLDAGHDSYMCRIVYVDAWFFSPKCGQLLVFSSSDVPGG